MKPHRLIWLAAIMVVVLVGGSIRGSAGGSTVADADGCPRSGEMPKPADIQATRAAILCLLNLERVKRGLPALVRHPLLELSSQRHSDDMAARDFYEHDTPDGLDPQARMTAAGYTLAWTGENLYAGTGFEATPVRALRGWMKSPGHRANILRREFSEVGVGIAYEHPRAKSTDPGAVYTTNFGGG